MSGNPELNIKKNGVRDLRTALALLESCPVNWRSLM